MLSKRPTGKRPIQPAPAPIYSDYNNTSPFTISPRDILLSKRPTGKRPIQPVITNNDEIISYISGNSEATTLSQDPERPSVVTNKLTVAESNAAEALLDLPERAAVERAADKRAAAEALLELYANKYPAKPRKTRKNMP